jgi:hypothetical protein
VTQAANQFNQRILGFQSKQRTRKSVLSFQKPNFLEI